jgi:hypothetical protein
MMFSRLDTNTFINKATCRAPQAVRIKTRCAGNGAPLPSAVTRSRAACGAPSGRAARWPSTVLPRLAIARYYRVGAPCGLTARRLAAYGFIYEGISMNSTAIAGRRW